MKNKAYLLTLILVIFLNINNSFGQFTHYEDQLQASVGSYRTDLGMSVGVGGQYFTSNAVAIQVSLGYEWGRPYQAYFKSYSLDAGISYTPLELGKSLYINLKALGTVAAQKITDHSLISTSMVNFGGKAGAGIEYYLNQTTSLELAMLQGFYSKKVLGSKFYEIGLTIKININ